MKKKETSTGKDPDKCPRCGGTYVGGWLRDEARSEMLKTRRCVNCGHYELSPETTEPDKRGKSRQRPSLWDNDT